jgi:hypothetical protein
MTIIEDANEIEEIITKGENNLGMILITVKHDGEHVVKSTITTKDTLLTMIKTISAMSHDILGK